MKQKNNADLHIVKINEDTTDKLAEAIAEKLKYEERMDPMQELEEKIKRHRHWFWKNTIFIVVLVSMMIIGTYLLITLQTYTKVSVTQNVRGKNTNNSDYIQFLDGVIRYGRDGVSLIDKKGKEQWNQSSQMRNPIVDVCKNSAVVADKGGNSILVLQREGLKGEIQTTLPIEKVAVSSQGIVGVILKDELTPRVVCYDAAGNLLVEQKASVSGTGYPISLDISPDGNVLLISYLHVQDGIINTTVSYYNFKKDSGEGMDHKTKGEHYQNEIMPTTFFMDQTTSVIVGDTSLLIYKGTDTPKLSKEVKLEKSIKSVFYSDTYIGFILQNQGKAGNELRLYNKSGKQVLSKDFVGEYSRAKIVGNQVIMFDGKKCSVYTKSGIRKFEGELDVDAMEIVPMFGVNKYMVMSANGMEQVRFVK